MKTPNPDYSDGLTPNQRESIRAVLRRYSDVETAYLYGSRALGRFRTGSDIDLALEGDLDVSTLNRIALDLDDLLLPMEIDLSILRHIDNDALRAHIQRVGRVFYSTGEHRR